MSKFKGVSRNLWGARKRLDATIEAWASPGPGEPIEHLLISKNDARSQLIGANVGPEVLRTCSEVHIHIGDADAPFAMLMGQAAMDHFEPRQILQIGLYRDPRCIQLIIVANAIASSVAPSTQQALI